MLEIKTIEYLCSKELEEIKFGAFLLRRYFELAASKEDEINNKNLKYDFHVDKFIEKDIIKPSLLELVAYNLKKSCEESKACCITPIKNSIIAEKRRIFNIFPRKTHAFVNLLY